jgi:hypothetical protein
MHASRSLSLRIAAVSSLVAILVACQTDPSQGSGALENEVDAGPEKTPDAAAPAPDGGVPAPDAAVVCDAAPPPVCGDGVCDEGEICEADCCDHTCGDGMCSEGEDCPADCPPGTCGDGHCDDGEDCPADCPPDTCGDGTCSEGEDCEADCGEEAGCTRTLGYWKTHNEHRGNPSQQIDWPAPLDEDDTLCDRTLLSILQSPSRGDAWVILAHQYVAARLNVASGASTPDAVDEALSDAEAFLLGNCGGVPASTAPEAIAMAETLDAYNHGATGPGHCD